MSNLAECFEAWTGDTLELSPRAQALLPDGTELTYIKGDKEEELRIKVPRETPVAKGSPEPSFQVVLN